MSLHGARKFMAGLWPHPQRSMPEDIEAQSVLHNATLRRALVAVEQSNAGSRDPRASRAVAELRTLERTARARPR